MSKDVNKLLAGQLLIVEVDAITSELISNNLTALKKIRIVANGKSAVKFCQLYKPDIIVLDVYLPDINGIERYRLPKEATISLNSSTMTC